MDQQTTPFKDVLFSDEDAANIQIQLNNLREVRDNYGTATSFQISPDLDKELMEQATHYITVCEALAQARSISDGLKLEFDNSIALAQLRTRQFYEDTDESFLPFPINGRQEYKLAKSTEGSISCAVDSYDHIKAIREIQILANFYVNELSGIKEAWLQRSIMLKTLVERQMASSYDGSLMDNSKHFAAKAKESLTSQRIKSST